MTDIEKRSEQPNHDHFYMSIPKSIPVSIVLAILIQVGVVIWAVSSFYKENEIMQRIISEQFISLQAEVSSIKASIYTRQEALVLERRVEKAEDRINWLERNAHDKVVIEEAAKGAKK
jgi:hypothetical protein